VVASGEDVSQHHIVSLLLLRIPWQSETVEVGIRNPKVFRLSTAEGPHAGEAVCATCASRIDSQAEAGQSTLAVPAEAARDVERQTNPVADLDPVDGIADLNDLAKVLVA
jgi:hypothetical protein